MKTLKRIIRDIIDVLGTTLMILGEVGLIMFGLSHLWTIGKINFIVIFIVIGIIEAIKIKKGMNE